MKRNAIFILILCAHNLSGVKKRPDQILKSLLRNKSPITSQNHATFIHSLRDTRPLSYELMHRCVNKLSESKQFEPIAEHSKILETAINRFYTSPGFRETFITFLSRVTCPANAKGHFFEIATAVKLAEQTYKNCSIAFNQQKYVPGLKSREFDIIAKIEDENSAKLTQEEWIECKDIKWKMCPVYKKQFLDQKQLVDAENMKNQRVKYRIISRTPIPENWKQWFEQNNITYTEDIS